MADYVDDFYNKMKRTSTRSFFPAANNALATGVRSTPYGGGSGNYGFGPNSGLVSPDQNQAYQAALTRNPTPASRYAAARSAAQPIIPSVTGTYQGMYGKNTIVDTGEGGFRDYSASGGFIGRRGNAADYLNRQISGAPPAQPLGLGNAINYLTSNNPALSAAGEIGRGIGQIYRSFTGNQPIQSQPNNALAAVQNFQQSGQFNLQPTQPRRYFDPAQNYNF